MKTSRRSFLKYGLAATTLAPALRLAAASSGYPRSEVEQRLASGRPLTKHDLPTPSLLLDLDAFESNLARMATHAKTAGIALRPHAKTHKCVEVARRQVAAGALGVCVATMREAEAMAAGGIGGLLITSEMVGTDKIARLVQLTRQQGDTMSVVDHLEHARQLNDAAGAAGVKLNVMIDIDPGNRRTGIAPGAPAKALAQQIARWPNLALRGIHSYAGPSSHIVGYEARRTHSHHAMAPAIATFAELRQEGLPLEILSGGSTGTYNIDPDLKAMTELQVGSYVFMDVDYRKIGGRGGAVYDDFRPALTVLATVISKSYRESATVDAGFKAFATDRKFGPELKDVTGVEYGFGGDEHGILKLVAPSRAIELGDRLEFIVPHCDPNVNLYDRLIGLRGDKVEAIWPVARGYG